MRPNWDENWMPDPDTTEVVSFTTSGHYTWTAPSNACPGRQFAPVWTGVKAAGSLGSKASWQDIQPGETIDLFVGGCPSGSSGGYNGGGSGFDGGAWYLRSGGYGASDIRKSGSGLGNRILVAGGLGGFALDTTENGTQIFTTDITVAMERYPRWYYSGLYHRIAPDESNVIHHELGVPGQGGSGASMGSSVDVNLEWPTGATHGPLLGYWSGSETIPWTSHAGGGGGGYVGGNSGYITFLEKGNIGPWLPPNYYTPDAGQDPDPTPIPPAYYTNPEYDDFGGIITPGYWTYPYGNPRDEVWPVTSEAELSSDLVVYWGGYAEYDEAYTPSAGRRGSNYDIHTGDNSAPWGAANIDSYTDLVDVLEYDNANRGPETDGAIYIMYGCTTTRYWNVGFVGSQYVG